jgi:hypothetical protein
MQNPAQPNAPAPQENKATVEDVANAPSPAKTDAAYDGGLLQNVTGRALSVVKGHGPNLDEGGVRLSGERPKFFGNE